LIWLIKAVISLGLAVWLTIAALNNVIDRMTNRHLLKSMLSMALLAGETTLGVGLKTRAIHKKDFEKYLLWGVVLIQIIIALFLWVGGISFIGCLLHIETSTEMAMVFSDMGLLGFICLWLFFLCGGLWFGYWIKMPQVQQVHMMLLIIGCLAIIIMNKPDSSGIITLF